MKAEEVDQFIARAFDTQGGRFRDVLGEVCRQLASICLPWYLTVQMLGINPVLHHLKVFAGCLRIAVTKNIPTREALQLLSLALTHDTSPQAKLTKQDAANLGGRAELARKVSRLIHMFEGALNSIRAMMLTNFALGDEFYTYEDFEVIPIDAARHDFHSLARMIVREPGSRLWLFAQIDVLWLTDEDGPGADLNRSGKDPADDNELLSQLKYNIANTRKRLKYVERAAGDEGRTFPDEDVETVFLEQIEHWAERFSTTSDELLRA